MRWQWNPRGEMVPFIGLCWWDGELIVALWPVVLRFGRAKSLVGWRRWDATSQDWERLDGSR